MYFELDVFFGDLTGLILLEVEKTVPGMKIEVPDFLSKFLIKEVTGDPKYSNASLAHGVIPMV